MQLAIIIIVIIIIIINAYVLLNLFISFTGTVFAYGVTSSGKTHTMHVSHLLND